jgi:hypothetical protein
MRTPVKQRRGKIKTQVRISTTRTFGMPSLDVRVVVVVGLGSPTSILLLIK